MKIESEKLLERKLGEKLKAMGGWSVKFVPDFAAGFPDRICLLPKGVIFFAEIKTTKEKPTKLQELIHRRLRRLGFRVEVIDRSIQIEELLKEYE